jgi:hypothetical protein
VHFWQYEILIGHLEEGVFFDWFNLLCRIKSGVFTKEREGDREFNSMYF